MFWPWPHGETITVLDGTVTGSDDDGNDVRLWPPKASYDNIAVGPSDANAQVSNEFTNARDLVTIGINLYVPPDADIAAVDRVIVRGEEFEVQNEADYWQSPYTGTRPGKVITLGRRTG